MRVWGIGSKQNTGVSKANSALSHIWLKTKLRIDSEILRIDQQSLERITMHQFFLPPLGFMGIINVNDWIIMKYLFYKLQKQFKE